MWTGGYAFVVISLVAQLSSALRGIYDEDIAQALADYCGAAYACGVVENACKTWSCPSCARHPNAEVLRFQSTTPESVASGFIAYDPDIDKIIVTFSGTRVMDVQNWVSNADSVLVDLPGYYCSDCAVHGGFLMTYQAVGPQVVDALKYAKAQVPEADIWITGHSLGGALAVLCALDLQNNYDITPQLLYTFGQPRVGNVPFANQLLLLLPNTDYFRLVHDQDPVPHIPPMLLGFQHSATEVFYNGPETAYRVCDDSGEDVTCSDQYLLTFNADHHMRYLGVKM